MPRDYEVTAEDKLSLRKSILVGVLSEDFLVSRDEGWWENRNTFPPILKLSTIKIL